MRLARPYIYRQTQATHASSHLALSQPLGLEVILLYLHSQLTLTLLSLIL